MPRDGKTPHICLVAGEASGDVLGARLMAAIRAESGPNIRFTGVGGVQMEAEGMTSLFPMRDLSVMGIAEVLPRLGKIIRRINQTVAFIAEERPDVIVTIDSPDFNFRVAKKVREKVSGGLKMVHYVAPTVWAWRPERAKKVAMLYDGIMCLFPFEPPYFEAEGMKASFVGHPVLESAGGDMPGDSLREDLGIPDDAQVLGILFGSRMGELNRVGPVLRKAAEILATDNKDMHILSPTLPHLEDQVLNLLQKLPCKTHIVTDPSRKWEAFAAMDRALATSGTVGLELAVADVPHIIAYKTSPLTYQIVKRKVTVKYAHLANILLDRPVVPEFIQGDCNAADIAAAMEVLDTAEQKTAFQEVRKQLTGTGGESPSQQAAKFTLDYLRFFIGT